MTVRELSEDEKTIVWGLPTSTQASSSTDIAGSALLPVSKVRELISVLMERGVVLHAGEVAGESGYSLTSEGRELKLQLVRHRWEPPHSYR